MNAFSRGFRDAFDVLRAMTPKELARRIKRGEVWMLEEPPTGTRQQLSETTEPLEQDVSGGLITQPDILKAVQTKKLL